ncbi:MAG: c-type cytochrome [Wolinella sp.]
MGAKIDGRSLKIVDRQMVQKNATDVKNSEVVYQRECASCHVVNGESMRAESRNGKSAGYTFPPLCGSDDIYNTGTEAIRMLKSADFIKKHNAKRCAKSKR